MGMTREQRIRCRAEMYIKGELTLEGFNSLEALSIEEDEEEQKLQDKANKNLELSTAGEEPGETEAKDLEKILKQEEESVSPVRSKRKGNKLSSITLEEYNTLSLREQQKIAEADSQGLQDLIQGKITELLYKPKEEAVEVPKYSLEEFRNLSLKKTNELFTYDNPQYQALVKEARETREANLDTKLQDLTQAGLTIL